MKYNKNTINIIIFLILVLLIILVVYLIKSHEKMEPNLGSGEAKLWILNKCLTYKDLKVIVRGDGDAILYNSSIAPDKMSIPITIPNNAAGSTLLKTVTTIAGSTYPKNITARKGHNYSISIDKDYMDPAGKPKFLVQET